MTIQELKNKKMFDYILFGGVALVVIGVIIAAIKAANDKNKDGVDKKTGIFDNEVGSLITPQDGQNTEGGDAGEVLSNGSTSKTYAEQPIKMNHFEISEFDSKGTDEAGTGKNMRVSTLRMLDKARELSGVSFHINSGFRTIAHNKKVNGVSDSAHTKGYAADIAAKDEATQIKMLKALYAAGFRRFGVYATFVHADNDPNKKQAFWREGGTTFNPLNA